VLDKLLDIGCMFDWITPVKALAGKGRMTDFRIPEDCTAEASQIAGNLSNPMFVNGDFMFQVPDAQAEHVKRALRRAGIPYATDK
jgi:hypothetical protein